MAAVECKVCTKKAYPLESISVDGDTYHKACFKCHECKAPLTLKNMAKINGTPYCKPHFKQMFAEAGGDYGVFGNNPEHKQWEKVAYSPGVVVNASVVSDATSPTASRGHSRAASVAVASAPSAVVSHARSQSAPANCSQHDELMILISQKDVAAVKKFINQHGTSLLFAQDSRKRTPIEIAFTEGANAVGSAMIEILQQHFVVAETSAGIASVSLATSAPATIIEEPAAEVKAEVNESDNQTESDQQN